MLIKEAGTYRGCILDHAVSQSSGGFPQWTPCLQATEKYDFETQMWVNWAGRQDCELTGYLTLFSAKGDATFHVADIMQTLEWDGRSLVALNNMDLNQAAIQFVVAENLYNNEVKMKVVKVAPYDTVPSVGNIRKLSSEDLAGLEGQFSALLKRNVGPAKPVSAPTSAPAVKPPTQVTATAPATVPQVDAPGMVKQGRRPRTTKPDVAPPAVADMPGQTTMQMPDEVSEEQDPEPAIDAPHKQGPMTKAEAWAGCVNLKAKDVTDQELTKCWQIAVRNYGKPEAQFTQEDWANIYTTVCNEKGVF